MLRAQRDCLEDVRPPPDAAVNRDLDAAPFGDGGAEPERVECGGGVVELAAAVVGDDDAVDTVRDCELDVGGVEDWGC